MGRVRSAQRNGQQPLVTSLTAFREIIHLIIVLFCIKSQKSLVVLLTAIIGFYFLIIRNCCRIR